MSSRTILILGASGHGKVVIDALYCSDPKVAIEWADADTSKHGQIIWGLSITAIPGTVSTGQRFHIAIGNNQIRERLTRLLLDQHALHQSIIHPRATLASSSVAGNGSFVATNAVLGPDSQLGTGCIVNHGAIVDHDCRVGPFCHVAPNATLAGGVTLGSRVLIGAGANVLPGVRIGDDCIIGAGAVVLEDIPASTTYVGIPARRINRDSP